MTLFKSKILLLLLGFMCINASLMAQSSLTLDASQQFSTFKFTDSQGSQDKNYSGSYSGAYSIGYRHGGELGGLLVRASIGMRKAGATMVYDDTNYMWDLQYADVKAGIGYMLFAERLQPYITASPYFAYLLKANQLINNENFDLLESGSLKSSDYGVFVTPGVQITLSDSFSVYIEFNYMMGLQNIETGNNEQKAYNHAYALTLGASFNITKK
jgi:hypothetical protein